MRNTSEIVSVIQIAAIAALLGFAAWRDIVTRTIPDTISIVLVLIGCGTRLAQGWQPFWVSLIIAVAVFISLAPLCLRGILGGADLKLIAALSVGLSPNASLHLLVDVTIVGGVLAMLYLALDKLLLALRMQAPPRGRANSMLSRIVSIEFWRIKRHSPLPYGIAIAVGAVFAALNQQGV